MDLKSSSLGFHLSGVVVCYSNTNNNSSSSGLNRTNYNNAMNMQQQNNGLVQNLTGSSHQPMLQNNSSLALVKRFNVAVTLDRGKITSCSCTCNPNVSWCAHVVALCLHRIHMVLRHKSIIFLVVIVWFTAVYRLFPRPTLRISFAAGKGTIAKVLAVPDLRTAALLSAHGPAAFGLVALPFGAHQRALWCARPDGRRVVERRVALVP